MASSVTTARRPRVLARVAACVAVVLGLLVSAAVTDRAEPRGMNRAPLPRDPIAGSCWPLPTERHLGFAYQVRGDDRTRDAGGERRRVLTIQYDEVDADDVRADVDDLLASAGFTQTSAGEHVKPGWGTVRFEVSQLPGISEDSIVRGALELDLPAAAARDEARGCDHGGRPG